MNRKYDIGFIINPEATEDEIKKIIDSVTTIITNKNGTIENIDEWGRRKLAYTIQKHNEGFYVFLITEAPGSTILEVERRLKLTEKVMRFVTLRLDDKLKKANKLTKKWKRTERLTRKHQDREDAPASDNRESKREARDEK